MILGDPYKFAVCFQTIPEWNKDDTFRNGVLLFFIDGEIFPPKELVNATLSFEINYLQQRLNKIAKDRKIYAMNKEQAFSEMYEQSFQMIEPPNYFDIHPVIFGDFHCFVFAVSNGENVRILASQPSYSKEEGHHILEDIPIAETFVSQKYLLDIASGLETWLKNDK